MFSARDSGHGLVGHFDTRLSWRPAAPSRTTRIMARVLLALPRCSFYTSTLSAFFARRSWLGLAWLGPGLERLCCTFIYSTVRREEVRCIPSQLARSAQGAGRADPPHPAGRQKNRSGGMTADGSGAVKAEPAQAPAGGASGVHVPLSRAVLPDAVRNCSETSLSERTELLFCTEDASRGPLACAGARAALPTRCSSLTLPASPWQA